MASGGDADFQSRIVLFERSMHARSMHAWERERKSLEGRMKKLEGENISLKGHIKSLEGQMKNLEGQNISLEGQIKILEARQIYGETCAESDSMIWGRPFLFGTVGKPFQWCLRKQPRAKSSINLFWKRRRSSARAKSSSTLFWKRRRSSAVRRASSYLRMSPPDFARFADSCIDEQKENAAHFQTVDELVDAIPHCRDLLARSPLLQVQFSKPALAISHSELLRAVYNF
jgi:hypothetical protein